MYSVEAKNIDAIVARYGPSTKMGAIVGGQTSTKAPEIAAFEKHLPADVEIVSCHSLHGPGVNPKGQPLVIINHRASQKSVDLVESILSCFESTFVPLSAEKHDRITADTQAVTHLAFLSMGTAWCANDQFPWEVPRYIGGIENVKINLMMRIYSNKWHVYAGLAILNPAAKAQIRQYAESVTDLYKMMLSGQTEQFSERIYAARDAVFGADAGTKKQKKSSSGGNDDEDEEEEELLLEDELLDKFSLGDKPQQRVKNNHLSLLAIVDCWWKLGIVPYDHMICSTPVGFHSPLPLPPPPSSSCQPAIYPFSIPFTPNWHETKKLFRLWLGITEYVYRSPSLLSECIDTALHDVSFRADDLEFTFAARDWSECVQLGHMDGYREKFEKIQKYFAPRVEDATKVGNEMIKTIEANLKEKRMRKKGEEARG